MAKKKINELEPNEKGKIVMIRGGGYFHKHLQYIGVTFGSIVQVFNSNIFSQPLVQLSPAFNGEMKYLVTCSRPHCPNTIAALSEKEASQIYVDTIQ